MAVCSQKEDKMAGQEGTRLKDFISNIIDQDVAHPLPGTPKLSPELADSIKNAVAADIVSDLNKATHPDAYDAVATDLRHMAHRIQDLTDPKGNRTTAELEKHAKTLEDFAANGRRTD